MKYPVLFVLAFLALCGALFAQNPTSQLNGSVTDPQGAAVINASVVVTDAETNARYPVTTNERGEWVVVSLPPSTYRVTVTLQGFKTATVQNVKLNEFLAATKSST